MADINLLTLKPFWVLQHINVTMNIFQEVKNGNFGKKNKTSTFSAF